MATVWLTIEHWGYSPEVQLFFITDWENIHILQVSEDNNDLIGII